MITSKSSLDYSLSKINAFKKQIESNKIYLEGLKQELQLGERTTLDVLNGEQELLESSLGLVMAYKDYFISYYELLFHLGKLNAKDLNLNVILFDDEKNAASPVGILFSNKNSLENIFEPSSCAPLASGPKTRTLESDK